MDDKKHISVYRRELKYFIKYTDYFKLREILLRSMRHDIHTGTSNGYFVRSLYFDTPDDKDYVEKVLGIEDRKKIRLRIYNLDDKNVKLEIKSKFNNYIHKDTTKLTREQAKRFVAGDKSFLLDPHDKTMNRVYYYMSEMYYSPTVVIDYIRDAFIADFNNIRITFDKDIKSCASEYDLFSTDMHFLAVFDKATVVMEVKYDRFLPKWMKMILSCSDTLHSAISKYCYGRKAYA